MIRIIYGHDSVICIITTSWVHASVGVSYNSTGSGRYRRCPHGQVVRQRFMIGNNPCNRGGDGPSFPYLDDSVQSAPFVYINCITIYDRAIRYLWLLNGAAYVAISRLYTIVRLFVGLRNGFDPLEFTSFWVIRLCLQFNLENKVRIWEETNGCSRSLDLLNNIFTVSVMQCTLVTWIQDYSIFICDCCEVVPGRFILSFISRNCF